MPFQFPPEATLEANGVWRFFPPDREAYFSRFIQEYEAIRSQEGRSRQAPDTYPGLPFGMENTPFAEYWRIRSKTFAALMSHVVLPLDRSCNHVPRVADLGAGNGWLSHRLAQFGFDVCAVDLLTNDWDGLGAKRHYPTPFTAVQSDFDRLPFANGELDLLIYNASFHYSENYSVSLDEALRVLRPDGRVVLMDTAVFSSEAAGRKMVKEREESYAETYGFASNAIPSENFLTLDRLHNLADGHGLEWEMHEPFYGWSWAARPVKAKLRRRRPPGRFMLVVGQRAKD